MLDILYRENNTYTKTLKVKPTTFTYQVSGSIILPVCITRVLMRAVLPNFRICLPQIEIGKRKTRSDKINEY